MDMKLETPEIAEEEKPAISEKDANFLLSSSGIDQIEINGEPVELEAFDTYRQAAASMMGCAFMKFSGDQIREFMAGGTYNGMWRDVVIYGWLCTNDKKAALRAASSPMTYTEQAMEWAVENGVGLMSDKAEILADSLGKTIVQIYTSGVEIDQTGKKGGGGESLGE